MIRRRLAALEAQIAACLPKRQPRTFVVMPWDIEPEAEDDDLVMRVMFIRPTASVGGEPVPYARTGIHPSEDDPSSMNYRLHPGRILSASRSPEMSHA